MADVIRKFCDPHLQRGEEVGGRAHTLVIDGVEYKLDACDEDWADSTQMLVLMLENIGTKVTKRTGRPGTPQTCTVCGATKDSKVALRKHMAEDHGDTPEVPQEFPCLSPGCDHAPFRNNIGRAQHMRQKHNLDKEGRAA